jgi:hypothetical protein
MGIFDYFKNYKENSRRSSLRKNIACLSNKHQLTENRYAAAEALGKEGTDVAIAGLLRRYDFTYENSIKDKAEKEYVANLIEGFGDRAILIVKEYIQKGTNIAWPLKILDKLISKREVLDFLLSNLSLEDATFRENILEKRLDILNYLAEFKDKEIVRKVIAFLSDEEEEVRFRAIEVLGEQGDEDAKDPIVKLLVDENESSRIKMKIFDVLLNHNWSVAGYRKTVEEILPQGYYLTRDGTIKIRGNVSGEI